MPALFEHWRPRPISPTEPTAAPWVPDYQQADVLARADRVIVQCDAVLAALRAAKQETAAKEE